MTNDPYIERISSACDLTALEKVRVAALGKAGDITALLKSLGGMTPEQRASEGPRIHALRESITTAIARRKSELERAELEARLATERLDLSLPGAHTPRGSVHPVSQVLDELAEIFADLGFAVAEGPEIEDDWHNFTALNIPQSHPARAMHDTFYIAGSEGKRVLRTHTSPVQIRTMMAQEPPIRIIAPGRVYRSDSDATHTPMFHQIEGLVIDKDITMGHLKWTLETFLKAFFERDDIVLRLRPSYFPFTEPSAEVDVGWSTEKGRRVVGGSEGWLEVLGSGMVHPRVLSACGLDPAEWQGFAFGTGVDRLAMLKYGMNDLRAFFDGDLRWLRHYGFSSLDVPTLSGDRRVKFSRSWLTDHLDTDASPSVIAATLTGIGLEVESVSNPAELLGPFRIARVLTAERHPQADKLQILTVDAGEATLLQVVCGAPNARAGLIGVFGGAGTYVPGSDFTLGKATIRGIESNGMMCSFRELKLGDDHEGIIELPSDAPVGQGYADWAKLDDAVFDVAITPNRQDCMGVRGIARDLAAAGLGTLKPLEVPSIEGSEDNEVAIHIEDKQGCPAFFARSIRGVDNASSTPEWMRRRLEAAGQRSISAIVDITNYVMLDLGRPSHAYDVAKLTGALTARAAKDGEVVSALNGKDYTLTRSMTVIADDRQAHDIAGIMGGAASGVGVGSRDVLLEVAYFTPERIALTGQALALTSDARSRFERGVDPSFLDDGLAIITGHILKICGGKASRATRVGDPPLATGRIPLVPSLVPSLGGIEVSAERQNAILTALGFVVDNGEVVVPSWRRDVEGPADIVEEIIRIEGYDRIASTPLPRDAGVARPTATRTQLLERRVRRAAAARGLEEAITWSFIPVGQADLFGGGAAVLANPISEDMKAMRPSLLPGLIGAARRNFDRGATSARLFEIGRRYLPEDERPTITVLLAGERTPRHWQSGKAQIFDPFDAKTEVLALLDAAGSPVANLQSFPDAGPSWHPGRSASLGLGPKTILARFGEVHPAISEALDAPRGVVAAEIYLDAIPTPRDASRARGPFAPPSLQAISRDYSFTVPADLPAETLVRAIRGVDKSRITAARIFDRFENSTGLSLAVEAVFQPNDKSFTEAEISELSAGIIAAVGKLGAQLRG